MNLIKKLQSKIKEPAISLFQSNTFSIVLLIFSLLYSFSGIFFGLDFTDSFYHLNQALYPVSDTYLFPFFLSSLIIKKIIQLVGQEVIYLRLVNWILLTSSIFLPFLFLKVNRRKSEILFYSSIIIILFTPLNANILGYDTLSIVILSLLFSFTVLYIKVEKFYLIFFLSFFCAAAVLIRLPNALAIPVIFFILLRWEGVRKEEWAFKSTTIPIAFVFFTSLFCFLGYALYYNRWERFVAANPISQSHDPFLLFSNYFRDAVKLTGYCSLILFGSWGYKKINIPNFPLIKEAILVVFFVFCLLFSVGYSKYSPIIHCFC